MAKGKKSEFRPDPSEMISQEEAAKYFNRTGPMLTRWKKSGKYKGFYDEGVFLPELIASREEVVLAEAKESNGDPEEQRLQRAKAKAAARKVIREDQIESGKTIFVDDVVMGFDMIAQSFRDSVRMIGPTMASKTFEYLSTSLIEACENEQEQERVASILARVSVPLYTRFVADEADRTLGKFGDKISAVVLEAIERSRLA